MSEKKVLILTHPIGNNYGGIAQAYALQEYLRRLGFDPVTTNLPVQSRSQQALQYIKYLIRIILSRFTKKYSDLPPNANQLVTHNTNKFINRYINLLDNKQLGNPTISQEFQAIVVGSDQVWRQQYVPVDEYMLNFAQDWPVAKLSYAASFGRDDLGEYSPELITETARLAKLFNGISVREDSGVELVKKHWNVEAEHHVDPTLLFDSDHYTALIKEDNGLSHPSSGNLFAYVLDREGHKGQIIDKVAQELNLQEFHVLPPEPKTRHEILTNRDKYQLPPVSQWLRSFAESEFIITDSFHGTAFAIIFQKPFLAIGNPERGMARFTSLLKLFSLEHRLVSDANQVTTQLLQEKINWTQIDKIRQAEEKRSRQYLLNRVRSNRAGDRKNIDHE